MSDDAALPDAVRAAVLARCNVRVDEVLIVRPRTIPHTTSGKPSGLALRDRYERGDLAREARLRRLRCDLFDKLEPVRVALKAANGANPFGVVIEDLILSRRGRD